MKDKLDHPKGFTLIEVLLVVSLLSISLVLVSINLIRPLPKAKIESVSSDIVSLLNEAATKSGSGDTQGGINSSEYGVHYETDRYTLFKGTVFTPGSNDNFQVTLPQGINISANLP